MIKNLLLVALGGAVGTVGRYLVSKYLDCSFPWATLTVNLIGSMLIGILMGLIAKGTLSPEMKLLLVTGFCGGFTTFSTFANESFTMIKASDYLSTAIYAGVSMAVGILAVFLGMKIAA